MTEDKRSLSFYSNLGSAAQSMRPEQKNNVWPAHHSGRLGEWAFTVPEYLITIVIVAIVSGAMLEGYLFAARMHVMASAKLNASDQARVVLGQFAHDVRTATSFKIGTGSLSGFKATDVNELIKGNAIQIYPTSATNMFVRYFLESDTTNVNSYLTLKRCTYDASAAVELAFCLTNAVAFTAEDPWGNILTNDQPSKVVGVLLQFNQALFGPTGPTTANASQTLSDFYQLRAKINKRTSIGYQN